MLPRRSSVLVADAGERRGQARDLVHDLGRMRVVHRIAERLGEAHRDFPVRELRERLHDLAHPRDAPLGVGERAVLLEEGRTRQEDVRIARRLDQEQVLHDDAFHRGKRRSHVARVRVRLGEVLALDIERAETAVERRLEHVRDAKSWLVADRHIPGRLELATRDGIRHVPVARQLVRERAHVAGALHVVLSAQRIHAHALAAEVAGRHREVRDAHRPWSFPGCAR